MNTHAVDINNDLDKKVSKALVVEVIKSIADSLHNSNSVDFDIFNYTEEMDILLYDLCFRAFASMENQSGFSIGEANYLFKPIFSKSDSNIEEDFFIGKTALHAIEDEDIQQAIESLRTQNS